LTYYCGGDTREIRREIKKIVIPINPVSLPSLFFLPFNGVMNLNIKAYLLRWLCRCPLRVRTDSSEIQWLLYGKCSPTSHWHLSLLDHLQGAWGFLDSLSAISFGAFGYAGYFL